MSTLEAGSLLLRVYCVAGDEEGGKTLHEAIVAAARGAGLAGASVLQTKMGFSRGGLFYSDLLNEVLSAHQPIIVEVLDQPDRINAFLPALHALVRGRRLITAERAEVVLYKPQASP